MARDDKQIRNKLITLARQDLRRGDFRGAHRRYKRLSGLEPDNPSFHIKLADVAARLGRTDEAIDAYLRAGTLFARDSFEEKTIGVLKRALELDPCRPELSEGIATAYLRLGRQSDALAALREAVDLLESRSAMEAALRLRRTIARIDSMDVSGRFRLAQELERQGMDEEAAFEYAEGIVEAARQNDPQRIPAAFRALLALEPRGFAGLVGEDTTEAEAEAALEALYAPRVYRQTLENMYRRVAEAYRGNGGATAP